MVLFLKLKLLYSVKHSTSQRVMSDQTSVHPKLTQVIRKHKQTLKYKKPTLTETTQALEAVECIICARAQPLIIDNGCGTGESAISLAEKFTDNTIIGIDKSSHRLNKAKKHSALPDNLIFVRANLVEFWLFAHERKWEIKKQYLLYPNPWPKQDQLMRRWHAHPIMPLLVSLSECLELRTNWKTYALEFAHAAEYFLEIKVKVQNWQPIKPLSLFEKKYLLCGHDLYKVELIRT